MKPEDAQYLTEKLLGEKYKDESLCIYCDKSDDDGFHAHYGNDYAAGKHDWEGYENRTFDTWADLGAVLLKLSKIAYIEINIYPGENVITIMPLDEVGLDCKSNRVKHSIGETPDDIPMRFCQLAADFLKERNK